MTKKCYRVYSKETVFYENVIEANSEKEAIKLVNDGMVEFIDPVDSEDFRAEEAEEITKDEYDFEYNYNRKQVLKRQTI